VPGYGYVGLDIGNTRLTAAAADESGTPLFRAQERAPASGTAEAALPVLYALADRALAALEASDRGLRAIGLGFGGPVDMERGTVRCSFHSAAWNDLALGRLFAARYGVPSVLDNDANAGGLGEALFGAGRGASSLLYVNVGTGIGGAVILGGAIHHGATSSAGEIGHVCVDPAGPLCNCGKRGCLEAISSGTGIARRAREVLASGAGRGSSLAALGETVRSEQVVEAAAAGDEVARSVVEGAGAALGLAIANVVNVLDPHLVVIGGGLSEAGEVFLGPVRQAFRTHAVPPACDETAIVVAALGYDAGVRGAVALALAAGPHDGSAEGEPA